jgi:hypothetical protein
MKREDLIGSELATGGCIEQREYASSDVNNAEQSQCNHHRL